MDALADRGDDWLTLNVWSPDLDGRLPVMVWIQGGAYVFGRSGLPEYDGSTLARGGVVLVTFNYRVGLDGFGWVEGTPPNRGLLDQVAALEWVRDNIGAFGGDPDRVTVFGQSAGGGSVAALLAMPRAAGLFHRAVVQSMPGTYFTPRLAGDITRACAAAIDLDPAELPGADPWALPAAGDAVAATMPRHADRWGRAAHALVPFAPVVDGDVLPTTPWLGLTGRVAVLVGHTRHEQRLLTALAGLLGEVTEDQAAEAAEIFGPDPQRYRDSFPDPEELYDVVRSDWLFRMPSLHLAQAQLAAGGRAHLYELTWPAPGMGGVLGACHGLDVPLVFGNLTRASRPCSSVSRRRRPRRCRSRCGSRGRRSRPVAIPAGRPTTPVRRDSSTRSLRSRTTRSRSPARSGTSRRGARAGKWVRRRTGHADGGAVDRRRTGISSSVYSVATARDEHE